MIDDLDLAFEDPDDRNRHRRRYVEQPAPRSGKKKKKKKKKKGGRSFLAFFMVVLLLGALGAGAWYGYDKVSGFFTTPDYDSTTGVTDVEVEIAEGANGSVMATALKEKDVVKSAAAFAEAFNADPKAKNIQPGVYRIRTGLSGAAAVTWLLDTKNRVVNGITVIEGRSMFETFKLLAEKTGLPEEDFKAAAADPLKYLDASWFERSDGKAVQPTLEGFLYPDTYEFKPKATAAEIIKIMVDRFKKVITELGFVDVVTRDRGGIKPYEALIVASLAQAEAGVKADLPKVARVAYQRAYSKTFPCGCLQMDVTVNYNFERQGLPRKTSSEMTVAELNNPANPYNRNLKGMIPTPINSPGKDALMGAMTPSPEKYLYFVAIDAAGNSAFATTYADHCKNVKTAFQNKVLRIAMLTRRAAVLGKPVGHSLSPVLHNAGYAAAGLTGWSYTAIECAEAELADLVAGLGPEWAGLSLTMPLKEVALTVATSVSPTAAAVGAANTLVRLPDGGWHADNTDVPGMVAALREVAGLERASSIAILGAGGTARAALAAAAQLGAVEVTVHARRPAAIEQLAPVAAALDIAIVPAGWDAAADCAAAELVLSTVPKGVADDLAVDWRPGTVLFDALYHPWPTPLAASAQAAGCRIVSGLDLLLAQALGQFEQFTGVAAPAAAMSAALREASRNR